MRRIKFEIDPEDKITGVKAMSLVDEPAMESEFIAFSKDKPQYIELKIQGYKQVVAGMALIPEKDILRQTADGEKYLAYFTKESIEKIRDKFHKEMMTSEVNVDHSQQDFIDAYLIESFIVDSAERMADLASRGIKDPVIGAWFVAYKIEDEQTFKRVLAGELRGFSVEIFVHKMFKVSRENDLAQIKEAIQEFRKDLVSKLHEETKLKSKGIFERRLKMIESEINN